MNTKFASNFHVNECIGLKIKIENISAKINFLLDLNSNKILSQILWNILWKMLHVGTKYFQPHFTKDRMTIFKCTAYFHARPARESYPNWWLLSSYLMYSWDCFTGTPNSPSPKLNCQPLKSCWINQYFWLYTQKLIAIFLATSILLGGS